ncbi:hypothetical protein AB1Y20_022391 [Prymnesium parvum]|uniref:Uncharacterized protein n=1 Tax=Prymnesium parvum TaxID=97485 RepID=A0AB34JG20_PRYPA
MVAEMEVEGAAVEGVGREEALDIHSPLRPCLNHTQTPAAGVQLAHRHRKCRRKRIGRSCHIAWGCSAAVRPEATAAVEGED